MSAAEAAAQLGRELATEREQEKQRDSDLVAQLRTIAAGLQAERKISDDRFETLSSKLDSVIALLTTNGSGGRHD